MANKYYDPSGYPQTGAPGSSAAMRSELATIATGFEGVEQDIDDALTGASGAVTAATTQAGIATTQAGIASDKAGIATTQAGIATTQADTSTTQAGIATTQAGIATTQAGIASDKAAEAVDAANEAQEAANTAVATAESLQIKLSEFVSVKDKGAVGDGITDDTEAIQAAVTAATGKALLFTEGDYKLTSPITISGRMRVIGYGDVEVRQTTAGIPAFIVTTDDVTFDGLYLNSTQAKTGSASSGPYRAGIGYHSGILQISGDRLAVTNCRFYNWTNGIGYHGVENNGALLAKGLTVSGCHFEKHDFGILARQIDGAVISNNFGRDCEDTTGNPAHLVYITDRTAAQSKGVVIEGNTEENNTSSESIKIRNVDGFSIIGNVARNCVRGIMVGFSKNGVISGNSVTELQSLVSDTNQCGATVDDSENVEVSGNVFDIGAIGAHGIRVRSDVGTFGNRRITLRGNTVVYDATSARAAYTIDSQTDLKLIGGTITNTGTDTALSPIRLNGTCLRVTIDSPVLGSSPTITNAERLLQVIAGTDTTLYVNHSLWPSWSLTGSVLDAGANTVVRSTDRATLRNGAVGAPSVTFDTDLDTGFYRTGTNTMGVSCGGVQTMRFLGNATEFKFLPRPDSDNVITNGNASFRWSVIYAGTGTINTSDAREKQQVRTLSDAEHAVAVRLKGLLRAFKFNDAVEVKGDAARIHFGVVAQDVKAAFEAEGLVAENYAMLCYDEWPEEYDEDGNLITPAGNRYGIRYEELLAFIIGALA